MSARSDTIFLSVEGEIKFSPIEIFSQSIDSEVQC